MNALAAVLLGFLDAARGGFFIKHVRPALATLLYGGVVSIMVGATGVWIAAGIVAFRIGESSGWGTPLGMALNGTARTGEFEWWQVGVLRDSPYAALAVRGAMWGLPMAALAHWVSPVLWYMPAVYAVAMPAAVYVASLKLTSRVEPWAVQEFLRGWLVGAALLALGGVYG